MAARRAFRGTIATVRRVAVVLMLLSAACSSKLAVDVELVTPPSPDPFEGVQTVRMSAVVQGRLVTVGEGRWDQGPLDLPTLVSVEAERFVVEGLSADGRVVSSGATRPLDLLSAPPDGALEVFFTRVGVLSLLEERSDVRRGGRAAALANGTVLFAGGVDAAGCPRDDTELFGLERPTLSPGPPLIDGRGEDFVLLPLADGRAVVAGGVRGAGCGAWQSTDRVVVFDGRSARPVDVAGVNIPGASYAALSDSEIIVSGGEGELVARTDVSRLEIDAGTLRSIGTLDGPRARAASVAISGGRVALLGGRGQRSAASALSTTSVFVPSRGAALDERIPLGLELIAPIVHRTIAGGVIYAGGRDAAGNGHAAVRALVVKTERDFPLGDTTAVTSMSSTVASGAFVDAGDGSLLFVSSERRVAHWIPLLPRRARALDTAGAALVGGGRIADGRVVLRAEDGRFFSFNPGIAGVLRVGRLSVTEGDELEGRSVGVVPLRPDAWRLTTEGLLVSRPASLEGDVEPKERGVFVDAPTTDFDVGFDLRLVDGGRAALLFGLLDARFDHVVLGTTVSLHRGDSSVACDAVATPALADGAFHRVRVVREAEAVTVEVDGAGVLACALPSPQLGRLGFGLVGGTATFDRLEITRE